MSGWVFCIFYKFNIYNSSNLASFSPTQLQRKVLPFKLLYPTMIKPEGRNCAASQRSLLPASRLVLQLRFYFSYSLEKLS